MLSKKAEEIMNTRACSVSLYTLRYIELQSFNRKTAITHNNFRHCRVRFSFVRPFSKQLYTALFRERRQCRKFIMGNFGHTKLPY